MNVKQLVDGTSYTYSDSYKTLQRYCKLKGSKLTFFEPKYSNFFLGFYKINLRKAGSYFDSITYFGCDIKETNEYFELNRVESALGYSRECRDLLIEYTINNKKWYDYYFEKKSDEEYKKYIKPSKFNEFKEKNDALRKRKGTYTFTYFDGFMNQDKYYNNINMLAYDEYANVCRKMNIHNFYYTSIDKSLKDGWTIQSSLERVYHQVNYAALVVVVNL